MHLPDEAVELAVSLYNGDEEFKEFVDGWLAGMAKAGALGSACELAQLELRRVLSSWVSGGYVHENLAQWLLRAYQPSGDFRDFKASDESQNSPCK